MPLIEGAELSEDGEQDDVRPEVEVHVSLPGADDGVGEAFLLGMMKGNCLRLL